MENKGSIIFGNKILILLLSVCLVSFIAGTRTLNPTPGLLRRTLILNTQKNDSFQILVNECCRFKNVKDLSGKRNKEWQALLIKLRKYTSGINGSRMVIFKNTKYYIFTTQHDSDEIRMHWFNSENKTPGNFKAVKKNLAENNRIPLMITNGGMFNHDYEPVGLFIDDHSKTYFELDTATNIPNANFYLMPNGVFYIDANNIPHIDTTAIVSRLNKNELRKFKLATQSGPMLVINGNIHKAFLPESKNRKLRSGVGLIRGDNKKLVFAITDGETNFYDFALFFRDVFNCDNALFLDGVISQMYLHDLRPGETGGNFGPMISVSRKAKQ